MDGRAHHYRQQVVKSMLCYCRWDNTESSGRAYQMDISLASQWSCVTLPGGSKRFISFLLTDNNIYRSGDQVYGILFIYHLSLHAPESTVYIYTESGLWNHGNRVRCFCTYVKANQLSRSHGPVDAMIGVRVLLSRGWLSWLLRDILLGHCNVK